MYCHLVIFATVMVDQPISGLRRGTAPSWRSTSAPGSRQTSYLMSARPDATSRRFVTYSCQPEACPLKIMSSPSP